MKPTSTQFQLLQITALMHFFCFRREIGFRKNRMKNDRKLTQVRYSKLNGVYNFSLITTYGQLSHSIPSSIFCSELQTCSLCKRTELVTNYVADITSLNLELFSSVSQALTRMGLEWASLNGTDSCFNHNIVFCSLMLICT